MTFEESLEEVLGELRVAADAAQFASLCEHFELLQRWNRQINLTAVSDPREVARRHFGEAAFLHRELPAMASAVDVGSGGG
ncbi:MAG: class I SAM-dependent methyltransferase, partial [Bryobacterales bacterium]|nr:class I SAM-dependent methyltransferase [Bryobacterales bacterium]